MSRDVNRGKRRWAIYHARKAKGLTLKQLADKLHLDYITVSNYESGRRTPKQKRAWDSFDAICQLLDITREEALVITDERVQQGDGD